MWFDQPWALPLLVFIPLLIWRQRRRPAEAALRFSSIASVAMAEPGLRAGLVRLPFWLRIAALCLFILALARPQTGGEAVREPGRGVAIEMVIDRSGSMGLPMPYRGRRRSRLELAKDVLKDFVRGDGRELKGRGSDLVGVVAFARLPETVCPLTLSHESIPSLVSRLSPVRRLNDIGTAVGDAIALAAARLQASGARSKTMILITDGENNAGERNVWQAAQLAAHWGIRVHAIGINGSIPPSDSPMYDYTIKSRYTAEHDLAQLARLCGGVYRAVQDGEALRAVYAEIDRLEKSEIPRVRYTNGTERFTPFLVAAVLLLVAAGVCECTWLRRTP